MNLDQNTRYVQQVIFSWLPELQSEDQGLSIL